MKKVIYGDMERFGKLHCDAPQCGYDLPEPLPFTEELIGFRCPMCGSDMMTEIDYRNAARVLKIINWINKWFGWMGKEEEPPGLGETRIWIRDGGIEIKEIKDE